MTRSLASLTCIISLPSKQGSWGQHGAHLGPTGLRWAPRWAHQLCYLGEFDTACRLPLPNTILCIIIDRHLQTDLFTQLYIQCIYMFLIWIYHIRKYHRRLRYLVCAHIAYLIGWFIFFNAVYKPYMRNAAYTTCAKNICRLSITKIIFHVRTFIVSNIYVLFNTLCFRIQIYHPLSKYTICTW